MLLIRTQPLCTLYVIINLTAQHPFPNILCDHLWGHKRGWKEADDITSVAPVQDGVPVEISRVDIHLIPHSKHVPGHLLVSTHLKTRQVSKQIAIDSYSREVCQEWKRHIPTLYSITKYCIVRIGSRQWFRMFYRTLQSNLSRSSHFIWLINVLYDKWNILQ